MSLIHPPIRTRPFTSQPADNQTVGKLGTFIGVFTPTVLTILGVIMYLRFGWPAIPVPAAAFCIILLVGALAFRGAGAALRLQLPILLLIALSLLALAGGVYWSDGAARQMAHGSFGAFGFWAIFAVFFPAVTGIMAGLSLSGDLADPRRSIPRGKVLATLTGFAVYLLVPVLLYLGADVEDLRGDSLVWTRIALFGPWLVLPGLWGAIFSSAVGSILGAPRTLQALAMDRLAPRCLGTTEPAAEPVAGLLAALAIALIAVFLGDLNTVAEVVTLFFLSVYGTVNLVAALEHLSGNPSWRPEVKTPW
jgi:solute carrier family 12 (potassium/chloride transporter), member 4/6